MTNPSDTYVRPQPRSKTPYLLAAAGLILGTATAIGYFHSRDEGQRTYVPASRSETIGVPQKPDSLKQYHF